MTETDDLVDDLQSILDGFNADNRPDDAEAIAKAKALLEAQAADIARLRKYCSSAAHDYAGLLTAMEGCVGTSFAEAFRDLARELQVTSEFMKLAAEGAEDGTLYENELTKYKARAEAAERERDGALTYATRLLVSFVNEHCNPIPEWKPDTDLLGVLSQLDNASTITRGIKAERNAIRASTIEECAKVAEDFRHSTLINADRISEKTAHDIRALPATQKQEG